MLLPAIPEGRVCSEQASSAEYEHLSRDHEDGKENYSFSSAIRSDYKRHGFSAMLVVTQTRQHSNSNNSNRNIIINISFATRSIFFAPSR